MADKKVFEEGDLVFVQYNLKYYAEVIKVEIAPYGADKGHRIYKVRRLYDEYGNDTRSKITQSYDGSYLTKVDNQYMQMLCDRLERLEDIYKKHTRAAVARAT